VHALRLGEAQRAPDESLDPGPQIDGLAFHCLRVLLAHLRLCGVKMSLGGPPTVRGKLREPAWRQQRLSSQEALVLPRSAHVRHAPARLGINGMPQPPWLRLFRDIRPHLVEL